MPSRCAAPGHTDLVVTCSCGMDQRLPHGTRDQASTTILYHRLSSVEAALGMKIAINWTSGT